MNIFLYDKIKGDEREKQLFQKKVIKFSSALNIDPDWLMIVMNFESGLNPAAVNSVSGATGLIQFMPATATYLGTSTTLLKQMSSYEQLDYVYNYLKTYVGKMRSLTDVYLAVFYPYAAGKEDSYILGSHLSEAVVEKIASQNSIFDTDKDGKISKLEVTNYITNYAKKLGYTGSIKKKI